MEGLNKSDDLDTQPMPTSIELTEEEWDMLGDYYSDKPEDRDSAMRLINEKGISFDSGQRIVEIMKPNGEKVRKIITTSSKDFGTEVLQ